MVDIYYDRIWWCVKHAFNGEKALKDLELNFYRPAVKDEKDRKGLKKIMMENRDRFCDTLDVDIKAFVEGLERRKQFLHPDVIKSLTAKIGVFRNLLKVSNNPQVLELILREKIRDFPNARVETTLEAVQYFVPKAERESIKRLLIECKSKEK
jgi:hypothetical protein